MTPKDFYEYKDKEKIFEGSLRELTDTVRQTPGYKGIPAFYPVSPAYAGAAYMKPAYIQNKYRKAGDGL